MGVREITLLCSHNMLSTILYLLSVFKLIVHAFLAFIELHTGFLFYLLFLPLTFLLFYYMDECVKEIHYTFKFSYLGV